MGKECFGCAKGVAMCNMIPGLGLPKEIETLLNLGLAKRLMCRQMDRDVKVVCPGSHDHVGTEDHGNWWMWGPHRCVFLKDNKCEIHAVKPLECTNACCKTTYVDHREDIVTAWDTPYGLEIVQRWRDECGITELRS